MKQALYSILVDPIHSKPLSLEYQENTNEGEIIIGRLRATDGAVYPIRNGIPRFVLTEDADQLQTSQAFGFKWSRRNTYDSPEFKNISTQWYLEKYGFSSIQSWAEFFDSRRSILDVGCGSGYSSSLWMNTPYWQGKAMWVGVDISEAIDVALERLSHISNTHFLQADALQLPFQNDSFDTIFSEGVFHHTPSTRLALMSAVRVLAPGGEIQFYVYRRKGAVREFADDYIREQIGSLNDKDAWDAMRSLTQLGQALAKLQVEVTIPNDVPLLGIKAGKSDIQRLIYYNFAKLFWNDELSFEENVHVNFDWYRPRYAHRQTVDEVIAWCSEAGLSILRCHEDESGIAVRAYKN